MRKYIIITIILIFSLILFQKKDVILGDYTITSVVNTPSNQIANVTKANTWTLTQTFLSNLIVNGNLNLGSDIVNMLAGFDSSGNITSTSSPQVSYINATSSTATSTFTGGLTAGGTTGLSVLQNGNVGIATTSPQFNLDVGGTGIFGLNNSDVGLQVRNHSALRIGEADQDYPDYGFASIYRKYEDAIAISLGNPTWDEPIENPSTDVFFAGVVDNSYEFYFGDYKNNALGNYLGITDDGIILDSNSVGVMIGTTTPYLGQFVIDYGNPFANEIMFRISTGASLNRFTVDEDGDVVSGGTINSSGTITSGSDVIVAGSDVYDSSGNVGLLGEDSVYITMDYNNNDADTQAIYFGKNTNVGSIPTTGLLGILTETGLFGLGTSSPYANLSINTATSTGTIFDLSTTTGKTVKKIDAYGHEYIGGTTPTITSCSGCTLVPGSNDNAFRLLIGSTPISSAVITFANAWESSPLCFANETDTSAIHGVSASSTPTTITLNHFTGTTDEVWDVRCIGIIGSMY